MMRTEKEALALIREDYARETGERVSAAVAEVLLDMARYAHHERLAAMGYCPGGYCCDGTGEPETMGEDELRLLAESRFSTLDPCGWCGKPCGNLEGMCYECQCEAHAAGAFNMDGP
jgi:hypothetical protein